MSRLQSVHVEVLLRWHEGTVHWRITPAEKLQRRLTNLFQPWNPIRLPWVCIRCVWWCCSKTYPHYYILANVEFTSQCSCLQNAVHICGTSWQPTAWGICNLDSLVNIMSLHCTRVKWTYCPAYCKQTKGYWQSNAGLSLIVISHLTVSQLILRAWMLPAVLMAGISWFHKWDNIMQE